MTPFGGKSLNNMSSYNPIVFVKCPEIKILSQNQNHGKVVTECGNLCKWDDNQIEGLDISPCSVQTH